MNGINRTIMPVVSAIALVYAGMCFFATLHAYITTETHMIHIMLFFPKGDGALGFDLTAWFMDTLPSLYKSTDGVGLYQWMFESLFSYIEDLVGDMKFEILLVWLMAGFILACAGFISRNATDCTGQTNPAEYLWTHRPNAFAKCIAMPWGLIAGAWQKNKVLVIIPILLLFLYLPWSVMISLYLILPFLLVKMVIGAKINGARKTEEKEYRKNTEFGVCPHCKRNFDRPKIKCRCGLILDYPVPGIYGYKVQYCNKGHEISCESGKRSNLTTICPHCAKQIQTREARPITISMVGGTGTGKTSLMLSAVDTITKKARAADITVDSPSSGLSKESIAAKDYAPRTIPGETESQILFLRSMNLQDREIIFNDISGVEFQPAVDKVLFEEYYNYTDGLIFTIDPLAFNREYLRETPHEVFDSFHYMFTTVKGISPSTVSNIPIAVVATKNDLMNPHLEDEEVRQFIIDNGEENFVLVLESLFKEVKYFAVTAHGSECGSSMRPVWWIVDHIDKELTGIIQAE